MFLRLAGGTVSLCSRHLKRHLTVNQPAEFIRLPLRATLPGSQNTVLRYCSTYSTEKLRESSQPLTKVDTKIALGFTCKPCGQRTHRLISRAGYEIGLVVIKCSNCNNYHLIADNLGVFKDLAPGVKNIEDILAEKGESIRKHLETDEVFEVGDFPAENPVKDPKA
ncbi:DNL-type zinc finger protein-like [Paramacrobiotus metropolitanus]|uniref:DNL-type zinc finger protein-like n=1 Tax=Paramacrobiotus metropolitanus TaxID=2943436 RepID=UPI00244601EF|nr:DNL-type zinc finger protein-like [Paramacrobiotus metropolitanus]